MSNSTNDEGSSGGDGNILKKGPWTSAEDEILIAYVNKNGEGDWNAVQKHTSLARCGKSCRLRWANHLRPNLKKCPITPEEEALIVYLHAKMGNKWAKMAAQLPGRTDNEIKNFWNTRTKRHQRNGTPLYPFDLCAQVSDENQEQSIGDLNSGDRQHNAWAENAYAGGGIPEAQFDYLNPYLGASMYVAPLTESSVSNMMMGQGLGSQGCILHDPHNRKRLRGHDGFLPGSLPRTMCQNISNDSAEKFIGTFAPNYAYFIDPMGENPVPTGSVISGSHCPINGNHSTVNVELPSLQFSKSQYHDIDVDNWLATLSPFETAYTAETQSMQSQCSPLWNCGLLEDMLLKALKKQPTINSSSSSAMTPNGVIDCLPPNIYDPRWESNGDPTSPLGCSDASVFNEATLSVSGGSSAELPSSKGHSGTEIMLPSAEHVSTIDEMQRDIKPSPDLLRPDALLASGWLVENLLPAKEEEEDLNDALSTLLVNEYISSPCSEDLDLSSCPWNNMPLVCQIPEHP